MSTTKYDLKKINRDTKLYKTTEYDCDSIFDYMKLERNQPCKTNKMIWLSESEERAKFYGNQIKIFNVDSEIYLWKLMEEPYSFFLDNYVDNEFKGQMQVLLRLFGEGETLKDQAKTLYNFLTGSGIFNVRIQFDMLKNIRSQLTEKDNITFDNKTLGQFKITPDNKTLDDIINDYIAIGDTFDEETMNQTKQRLSIYGFDQILLKLICKSEQTSPNGIHGWYIPKDTTTVWVEVVNDNVVTDMEEIALFDNNSLSKCELSLEKASLKKKKRKKSKRKKKKKKSSKKKRFTKKRKVSKKRKKYKRLTKKGKEWAKSMSNYMKQKKK